VKPLQNPAVTALGATTIIFMVWLAPLASSLHQGFFHLPGSLLAVMIPLFIGFCAVWLFWSLLLAAGRKYPVLDTYVWGILIVILVRELIEAWNTLKPTDKLWEEVTPLPRWVNFLFLLIVLATLIVLPILHRRAPGALRRTKSFAAVVLAFVAFSGAFTLVKIALYTWQARNLNAPRPLHQPAVASAPKHPRVIWMLLDELSYRQVYEHRYPGLELPAFDRLAQDSSVFTDARPQGTLTENVVPSLISGISGYDNKAPAAGLPLYLRNSQTKQWQLIDPHQTVFQDVLNAGYSPSVAGWWIPYCRIFPEVLDHCYWTANASLVAGMYSTRSIAWNLKEFFTQPLLDRAAQFRLIHKHPEPSYTDQHVLYEQLVAAADGYLNDPSDDFIYLHMNLPHPQGFYNRHTGQFSTDKTGYIDNLALADIFLGHVRSLLEANGTWDDTTLVVMGDHSWRTNFIWAKTASWSSEEQAASDGDKFDDRPGYIVHLAGQKTPARIDTPYEAIRTRSLMDNLVQGKIVTPEQLAAWVK